jgi:hypothetical protein
MAELKTKPTKASVSKFLDSIKDDAMRDDCKVVARIMEKATKSKPVIWRGGLVGFGDYRYKSASGREGDWMLTAFAPRKGKFTVYVMPGFKGGAELKKQLGKHSGGLSCIHIRRLSDVHLPTLTKMINASVKHLKKISAPKS